MRDWIMQIGTANGLRPRSILGSTPRLRTKQRGKKYERQDDTKRILEVDEGQYRLKNYGQVRELEQRPYLKFGELWVRPPPCLPRFMPSYAIWQSGHSQNVVILSVRLRGWVPNYAPVRKR